MASIAHLTSAHPRHDTRIFIKQCRSMAGRGHDVTLVVADAQGDAWQDSVHILDVGTSTGRLDRVLRSSRRVCERGIGVDADIYVLHDPELIPAGLRLKKMGRKVVFDSHEDVPIQMRGKPYLGRTTALLLSRSYGTYERYACALFDGVVGATPVIRDKFRMINPRSIDINNYPILDEFSLPCNWADKALQICYVGNVTAMRGVRELVRACARLQTPATLALAGTFETSALAAEVSIHPGWRRVKSLGQLDRAGVRDVMAQSIAGLVTLHPQPNYLEALPVKMFEYMAAGIPVIASDFPLWRDIIEGAGCGMCVDPLDPCAIAAAIDYLVMRPDEARQMGLRGLRAAQDKYNWNIESHKLLNFYEDL